MSLTHSELKNLLHYDPNTGIFTSKVYRGKLKVGKQAGCVSPRGYVEIRINRRAYLAHRLAWFYCFGVWPNNKIDHINRIKSDNRITNLRDSTNSENMMNRGSDVGSSSLYKGVCYVKKRDHYQTNIDGIYLGVYDCEHEAAMVYNTYAEVRHGDYANLNKVFSNFEEVFTCDT